MVKTFGEVIRDIKGHQTWKPVSTDSRVKEIFEYKELGGILIKLDDNYDSVFIPSDMEFELQREEVSFEEAIQAFKEGKEIESCVTGMKYKIAHTGERVIHYYDEYAYDAIEANFSLESILGAWYIND